MKIVLLSTYELGRQPFGLASPAAWLRNRGHDVACFDLSRQAMDDAAVRAAELIAIYLPMHTATRLASRLVPSLRESNPKPQSAPFSKSQFIQTAKNLSTVNACRAEHYALFWDYF